MKAYVPGVLTMNCTFLKTTTSVRNTLSCTLDKLSPKLSLFVFFSSLVCAWGGLLLACYRSIHLRFGGVRAFLQYVSVTVKAPFSF